MLVSSRASAIASEPAKALPLGSTAVGCTMEVAVNEFSEEQWRSRLSRQAFEILRHKATERAFTGDYWDTWTAGTYHCAGCDTPLFRSTSKFDSGCGWPAFSEALRSDAVSTEVDRSHGMERTEVLCRSCGGHLGHVFSDGPPPLGTRYCINSGALKLVADPTSR